MALHQALQHLGGEENAAHYADSQGNQGQDVEIPNIFHYPFINPQHIEHLGHTDSRQNQPHGDDHAAHKLKQHPEKPSPFLRAEQSLGQKSQGHHQGDSDCRVDKGFHIQALHPGLPVDHGHATGHGSQEEKAHRNVRRPGQKGVDQPGEQNHAQPGPSHKKRQKRHALLRVFKK